MIQDGCKQSLRTSDLEFHICSRTSEEPLVKAHDSLREHFQQGLKDDALTSACRLNDTAKSPAKPKVQGGLFFLFLLSMEADGAERVQCYMR